MFHQKIPAWMNQPAPVNYVAGLGRGATGFTTRSDIGPARVASMEPGAELPAQFGRGDGNGEAPPQQHHKDEDDDREDYSESNYDEFSGYGGSLFDSSVPYEKDDEEADKIWMNVDDKMDSRRRERREARLKKEMEKYRAERPKIQQQFADLKRNLAVVSAEEWDAIPDIGDRSLRYKAKKVERYMPAPDSLLERARSESHANVIGPGLDTPLGGMTPYSSTPIHQDLTAIGSARTTMINMKLQQASDSVSGQTVVDPKNYLTDLRSIKVNTAAEITDIKRARLLLRSVTTTNPKHAPGWIAAARLEEVAGKLQAARKLIANGCQACPENEDVWLEAARLNAADNAKGIYAKAVKHIPHSVKIWLAAASLENDIKAKKKVLKRGLEFNPSSVRLWKAVVELEEPDDARIMLSRAVECVPHSVEMWLALAHLESYENARKVLNQARQHIPTDPQIWITAAKLEETQGNEKGVGDIIRRAIKSLASHQVLIDREQWIKEAENCEKSGSIGTCQAIIKETIGMGIEDEDRKSTWLEDAESCLAHECVHCARAILAHATTVFKGKKSVWLRIAHLERAHGTRESLEQVLKKAVQYCPQAEILWLMAAKEMWLAGDVEKAREILANAFKNNPNSEQVWLAAVKLESENNETQRARGLLERAREMCGTERVWMKSALFEREVGNLQGAIELLKQALVKYPKFAKLWMMRGQIEETLGTDPNVPHDTYQQGINNCPNSISLWILAATWEEKAFNVAKARVILEKARMKNPKNADLWLLAVRIEMRANNPKTANTLLAKGLQECPTSGILWAQAIHMELKPKQKAKSVHALKRCDDDPYVILVVAKIFWDDRKIDKARNWFNRAIALNPGLGDAWAQFYRFELQHGSEERQKQLVKKCIESEPRHGELWTRISKAVGNSRLTTEQILIKTALLYEHYDPCTGTVSNANNK